MELVKAIKASKEVFIEVVMNRTCFFVKVSKQDLIAQIKASTRFNEKELFIVQQYGTDALYLSTTPL